MKTISLFIAGIFAGIFLYATQPSIMGRVIDASTGEALTGAHVVISATPGHSMLMQAITGREGTFSFSGSLPERFSISVSYIGYKLYDHEFDRATGFPGMLEISLVPTVIPVGEVRVSALRRDKLLRNVSMPMAVITDRNIDRISAFSMADAISSQPGVSLARDGIWGTSVNIRGLSENRIVTLVDGNRVETSTDLAAGLSMIDVNDIERIEVIKGAASSLYGTGAMGGVVNIITKDGRYDENLYFEGNLSGAYHNVNRMHSEHLSLNAGNTNWYARVSGTYRAAENTMTPAGELSNSQFTDNNVSARFGLKPFDDHELKLNYQRFYARDVGIPGGKAFPGPATATYPRELREMLSASYEIQNKGEFMDDIKIKYFYQYILRDVLLRPNPNVAIDPNGYHTTHGIQLQTGWNMPQGHYLVAGIDMWQRYLQTDRERRVRQPIMGGEDSIIGFNHITFGEIPIPESWFRSAGIFLQDEFSVMSDRLKVTLGGRVDLINVENRAVLAPLYQVRNDVSINPPPGQRMTFQAGNENNLSWSVDAGLQYNIDENTDLTFTASRAFRSPSLDERFKYIDLGASVRLGDPLLKPEKAYFFDLGGRFWHDRFHLTLNTFVNFMTDMIVEVPGEAQFPLAENPDSMVTLAALINSNVDKAVLYGLDMGANYNFYNGFVVFGSLAYVRGMDTRNDLDLPFIPPLNGRTGLRYNLPKWFGSEVSVNIAADQNKIAEGETATRGYARYDFHIYSMPLDIGLFNLTLFAGVENITDKAYVNHLASNRGFVRNEPGRNVFVRVRVGF